MKKILLTEAEKNKIISEREKLIIQNFANTFNKIKRIDESEVDEKVIEEGLKANLAAAALAAAGAHGAQAQTNQPSIPNAHGKEIQASPNQQSLAGAANPYGAEDKSNLYSHTKPIVDIQPGVQDGKTGQPAIYVYHKDRNAPGFNPATDRTTVFTKNLDLLHKTREYQDYLRRKAAKNNSQLAGGVDESDINELSPETKFSAYNKADSDSQKYGNSMGGEHNELKSKRRMYQADKFTEVNNDIKQNVSDIAKYIIPGGDGVVKKMFWSDKPVAYVSFTNPDYNQYGDPKNNKILSYKITKDEIEKQGHSNVHIPDNIARRLERLIMKIQKEELPDLGSEKI